MIEKKTEIGIVSLLADGQLQIREDTIYLDDGIEVARNYHRYVLPPSDDASKLPERIKKIADIFWTPEAIAEYKRKKAESDKR